MRFSNGILPAQHLRCAVAAGYIRAAPYTIPEQNFQPASLDLRLGEVAHRLRCSFLPGEETVAAKLADYSMGEIDLRRGAVLEKNVPYLIPLTERLALPEELRAKANPKSSTGRLDVFTRVITDKSYKFDEIRAGYEGAMYLEVISRSFTIRLEQLLSLNQLRLLSGRVACTDDELTAIHAQAPMLFEPDGRETAPLTVDHGVFLSLDLRAQPRDRLIGYRAKKNTRLLDLSKIGAYAPADYWEEIRPEPSGRIVLNPEDFYLLLSRERIRIPANLAADMVPYDPASGELRTHYAGFFDPGFGIHCGKAGEGTVAALEVRAHDVPFMVEDGQRVCKLAFERMAEPPDVLYGERIGSSYYGQTTMLSKHFQLNEGQLPLLQ